MSKNLVNSAKVKNSIINILLNNTLDALKKRTADIPKFCDLGTRGF